MKVYIAKKDIPESCDDCPFQDYYSDFPNIFCNLNSEVINDGINDILKERHPDCNIRCLEDYLQNNAGSGEEERERNVQKKQQEE